MGTKTLQDRREYLAAMIGVPGTIQPALETMLDRCIHHALRQIYRAHSWNFLDLLSQGAVDTRFRVYKGTATGKVACDAAGTAVVGTDTDFTVLDTSVQSNIRIRAEAEICRVTTITDAENLVLTDAAPAAWAGSAFALYIDLFSLPATLSRIDAMWVGVPDNRIQPIGAAEMAEYKSRGFDSGHPQFFTPRGRDANEYVQVEFWPIPWYDEWVYITGRKAGTIPTAEAGVDDVPDEWSDVVDIFSEATLYRLKKDERFQVTLGLARGMLLEMVAQEYPNHGAADFGLDPAIFGLRPHGFPDGITTI